MKLKVIGWTYYDNGAVENGYCGWAAINAATDEILKKGYKFSGEDHQEMPRCVPVFNDGKKRTMTQRGWGRLMADAYGYNGMYDYSLFAFGMNNCTYPPVEEEYRTAFGSVEDLSAEDILNSSIFELIEKNSPAYEILTEEELREKITLPATVGELSKMLKAGKAAFKDTTELRYIDAGDILTLSVEGEEFSFIVKDVNREKDFTPEEDYLIMQSRYIFDEKVNKEAEELFGKTPMRVVIEGEFTKTDDWETEQKPEEDEDNLAKLKTLIDNINSRRENDVTSSDIESLFPVEFDDEDEDSADEDFDESADGIDGEDSADEDFDESAAVNLAVNADENPYKDTPSGDDDDELTAFIKSILYPDGENNGDASEDSEE